MVHVLAVGAGVGEALEALGALEGLLAAVQSLVFRQVMLVLKCFRALLTLVRPLPCNTERIIFLFFSLQPDNYQLQDTINPQLLYLI